MRAQKIKLRIFVIDDEISIRETMQWYLENQGHEVLTAPEPLLCDIYYDCECNEEDPCGDILFVDYNMPRMNGLELVELMSLRGCKGHPENKIIMSGDPSSIDREKAKDLGCTVEQKPINFKRVNEIIEKCKTRIRQDRKLADLSKKSSR